MTRATLADMRTAFRLIGECVEVGADPATWRTRLFEGLARVTGSTGAIGGETQGTLNGGVRFLQVLYTGFEPPSRHRHQHYVTSNAYRTIDTPLRRFMKSRRALTTRSHEQLITPREWHQSELFNDYFRHDDIDDRLLAVCRMPGSNDSPPADFALTLYRARGDKPFNSRDRALVHLVLTELRPLIGTALDTCRGRELRALPPRQQQVLKLLLDGASDKAIGARCGLSPATVREYVTAVYRHFGVSTRAQLLAAFLRWRGAINRTE